MAETFARMLPGYHVADIALTIIALLGVLVLTVTLHTGGQRKEGLARRFAFVLHTASCLLIGRIGFWGFDQGVFRVLTVVAAVLIPMAGLLLAEGLLRRHAPAALKQFVLTMTSAGIAFAFVSPAHSEPYFSACLFVYQALSLSCIAALLIGRDRASLSGAENAQVGRTLISLLVILPLLLSDFRMLVDTVPIRLGGLGMLVLCWLSLDGSVRSRSVASSLWRLGLLSSLGIATGLLLCLILSLSFVDGVRCLVIVTAGSLLLAIASDALHMPGRRRRDDLLHALATVPLESRADLLQHIGDFPLVDDATILDARELGEFDIDVLRERLAMKPIVHRGDLMQETGDAGDEQLTAVLALATSDCLLAVSLHPLSLLALNLPALGRTPAIELELAFIQRIATLLPSEAAASATQTGEVGR